MTKFYAGIGSRETPEAICRFMAQLADRLARRGYTLRSGGAHGADSAFESGVPEGFPKDIYLPWRGFNGNASPLFDYSDNQTVLNATASTYHPAWRHLPAAVRRLHGRNARRLRDLLDTERRRRRRYRSGDTHRQKSRHPGV